MADIAINPQTGEAVYLDNGAWVSAPVAKNPETGAEVIFDGSGWRPRPAPAKEAPSVGRDMLDSAGSGLVSGAASLPGIPADIGSLAQYGLDRARSWMPGAPSLEEVQAQSRANAIISPETLANYGGASMVKRLEDNVTGPLYKPETAAGKYVHSAAEFVPGTLLGPWGRAGQAVSTLGKVAARAPQLTTNALKFGVAPGLASEAAGQVTGDNPWAKGGAALATGGAAAFLTRRPPTNAAVTNATKGVTPAQVSEMEALMADAAGMGMTLTRAEALQQVTGGATKMGNLQRIVEGQGGLQPQMAARPGQIETAARQQFDRRLGPAAADVDVVGPQLGKSAENIVQEANTARAAATSPYYKAAATDTVPPQEIDALIGQINGWINSDKTKLTHGPLEKLKQALTEKPAVPAQGATATSPAVPAQAAQYITDIENLDRVRKNFRDQTKLPSIAPNALDKETGSKIGGLLGDLRTSMESASPSFVQAKTLHQDITKRVLDPLMAGPIGKIAQKDITTKNAIEALFPTNPLPNSAAKISSSVSALASKSPEAARQVVRAHVESVFNEATQAIQAGANQFGGAGFAAVLKGNAQQKANLEAAITALRGSQTTAGFNRFLEVLEATGQRQRMGSTTAFNTEAIANLKGGGNVNTVMSLAGGAGTQIPKSIRDKFQQWNLGKNTDALAKLLTDPAAAKVFRQLALAPTTGNKAILLTIQLGLLSNRAAQPSPKVGN